MMTMNTIQTTSQKAYAGYGHSDTAGLPYFGAYGEQFSAYDAAEVIAFQVQTYGERYSLDFLLSSPKLWVGMTIGSWENAMCRACPRSAPTVTTTGLDAYADVVFLCKYVGVDGIKLFLESNNIGAADKELLINQVKIHSLDLILEELDTEDLDGEYFVSSVIIDVVSKRLIENGGVERFDNDEASVRMYIDALK